MQKDVRRRGRWSEEEKRVLVARWQASGLSAREFGAREGILVGNLWNWKSLQAKAPRKSREAITFAPVRVKGEASVVRTDVLDASRIAMELAFESGVRLRVFSGADMRAVGELVDALSRRPSC